MKVTPGLLIVLLFAAAAVVWALARAGVFFWFGRLPGDIRYEGKTTRFYLPVMSMLLISAVISLANYLIRRFF